MRKILSFALVFISLNLVISHELPKKAYIISSREQPPTKSKLYPNPAVDFITIKNSTSTKFKNISILSMVGSSMINKDIFDSNISQEINVSKFPTGRYFVRVSYSDGSQEVLNLIKL